MQGMHLKGLLLITADSLDDIHLVNKLHWQHSYENEVFICKNCVNDDSVITRIVETEMTFQ